MAVAKTDPTQGHIESLIVRSGQTLSVRTSNFVPASVLTVPAVAAVQSPAGPEPGPLPPPGPEPEPAPASMPESEPESEQESLPAEADTKGRRKRRSRV